MVTHSYATDYFSITAEAAAAKINLIQQGSGAEKPQLQFSLDDGATWQTFIAGSSSVTLSSVGDKVLFRGTNPNGFNRAYDKGYKFTSTANISVGGNLMTLVDGDNPSSIVPATGCFALLFNGCTRLVSAANLLLPASSTPFAYYRMFMGCTALTTSPASIQMRTIEESACLDMFRGCTALTSMPVIAVDTIGESGCENMFMTCRALTNTHAVSAKVLLLKACSAMFSGCTALTSAVALNDVISIGERGCASMFASCTGITSCPALIAKTIGEAAYREMFNKCTSLTVAPAMQATVIGKYGCYKMYTGCTALTSSPDLIAPNVSTNAYEQMFAECQKLTAAPAISARVIGISTCNKMFYNCKALTSAQASLPSIAVSDSGCYSMFENCTALKNAISMPSVNVIGLHGCQAMYKGCTALLGGADQLAATRVMDYGYAEMFSKCSKMTSVAAELPAQHIGNYAYHQMMMNCQALTKTPYIYATTMGSNAMQQMFASCKALTTAQDVLLPTVMTPNCYASMFNGCSALTVAPELPAMTLANYCYNAMFSGCTALTKAPLLPALSLTYDNNGTPANYAGCYALMFYNCKNLTQLEVHFSEWGTGTGSNTDTSNKYPTNRWLEGASTIGTFRAPCSLTDIRGNHNIPTKWDFQCMVRLTFDVAANQGTWDGNNTDDRLLFVPIDNVPQAQREGCLFTGWNSEKDGTGAAFDIANQPATETTFYAQFEKIEFTVVDWLSDAFVTRTNLPRSLRAVIVPVNGEQSREVNMADALIDAPDVYAMSFDKTEIQSHAGEPLLITFYRSDNTLYGTYTLSIPYLVDAPTNLSSLSLSAADDVWIVEGGSLTADENREVHDLFISGGGKLFIPAEQTLNTNRCVLRSGALLIDKTYRFSTPQLIANGSLRTISSILDYEYLVSESQYYSLTLPYSVNVANVRYLDGTQAGLVIQQYNGAVRTTGQTGWNTLWNPFVGSTDYPDIQAGVGYTVYGIPQTVSYDGTQLKRTYTYLRFPMKANLVLGERATDGYRTVSVSPYGITGGTLDSNVRPNDAGWNLVGNPYLADYNALNSLTGSNPVALLELVNGEYQWVGTQRYVVLPSNDGRSYTPALASAASLPAFRAFFVQIGTGDALRFDLANRNQSAPYRAPEDRPQSIGLQVANSSQTDRIGLAISDAYTTDYEINADLAKWHNDSLNLAIRLGNDLLSIAAVNEQTALQLLPLTLETTADDTYTFSLDEQLTENAPEHLYLYDNETFAVTDIRQTTYSCHLSPARYTQRFFVSLQPYRTPTDITGIPVENTGTIAVYTLTGQCVYRAENDANMPLSLPQGLYLISNGSQTHTMVIR